MYIFCWSSSTYLQFNSHFQFFHFDFTQLVSTADARRIVPEFFWWQVSNSQFETRKEISKQWIKTHHKQGQASEFDISFEESDSDSEIENLEIYAAEALLEIPNERQS